MLPLLLPLFPLDIFPFADHRRHILASSALGSGILFSYPEISTITGVQGLIVYTLSSSLPLLIFAYLGPIIRRKCPEGFVLTEWTRQRYGVVAALYLSLLTYARMYFTLDSDMLTQLQLGNTVPLHGRRAIGTSANHQRAHRTRWTPGRHRRVRCYDNLYM